MPRGAGRYSACFFLSGRRRHTRYWRDWSSDVCSSDLVHLRIRYQTIALGIFLLKMRADEAARWCGRGGCGHSGVIEVIAVDGSGLLRREQALGCGIQFCLDVFAHLFVLTDPSDAEPASCFRAVYQLPHALLKAFGFECPFETSAIQDVTLPVGRGPFVVLLPEVSDGIEAARTDHAFFKEECAGWVHFLPRPFGGLLDLRRDDEPGLVPLHRAFDSPCQDRRFRFGCGEQRFEIRLDLRRLMVTRYADHSPPDRTVISLHKRQMIAGHHQFAGHPEIETILVQESCRNRIAARQLLQDSLGKPLTVINFAGGDEPCARQASNVLAGAAGYPIFLQERGEACCNVKLADSAAHGFE